MVFVDSREISAAQVNKVHENIVLHRTHVCVENMYGKKSVLLKDLLCPLFLRLVYVKNLHLHNNCLLTYSTMSHVIAPVLVKIYLSQCMALYIATSCRM